MRNVIVRMIATAAALWVAIWLVPGLDFQGSSWLSYLAVTALLVAVNWWVKPVMKLLGLPFILVTLGLFLLVINALALQLVIWMSEEWFELGLTSSGFFWATFLGALVISVLSGFISKLLD